MFLHHDVSSDWSPSRKVTISDEYSCDLHAGDYVFGRFMLPVSRVVATITLNIGSVKC